MQGLPLGESGLRYLRDSIRQHIETGESLDTLLGQNRKGWLLKQRSKHLRAAYAAFRVRYPDYDKLSDYHAYALSYMQAHWPKLRTLDKPPSFADAVQSNLWWACFYGSKLREQPLPTAKSQFNSLLDSSV